MRRQACFMQPNAHIVETLAANGTTEEMRTTLHELNEINGKEGCNHALYIGLCAAIACNHLHTAMSLILSCDENMLSEATAQAVRIAPSDMFYRISLGTLESDHVDQFPHLIHVAGLNCIPSRARWLASRWEGDVYLTSPCSKACTNQLIKSVLIVLLMASCILDFGATCSRSTCLR